MSARITSYNVCYTKLLRQVAQDPRQAGTNALAFNTRKSVSQNQLGLTYDIAFGNDDRIEARVYFGDRQVTQYLAIPLFSYNFV